MTRLRSRPPAPAENPPAAPKPPQPPRFVDPDEETVDPEEHARLVALYEGSLKNIAEGEVIKGTVLKVSESEVIVDVGYKSEGLIPLSEFYDENGEPMVQPGDTVERAARADRGS